MLIYCCFCLFLFFFKLFIWHGPDFSASDAKKHQKELFVVSVLTAPGSTPPAPTVTNDGNDGNDGPQCRRGHVLREYRGAIPPIGWRPRILQLQFTQLPAVA